MPPFQQLRKCPPNRPSSTPARSPTPEAKARAFTPTGCRRKAWRCRRTSRSCRWASPSRPQSLVHRVDLKRRLVFSVNADATGGVSSFKVEPPASSRRSTSSLRKAPAHAHLALDNSGKYLLVANYTSGSVAVIPVAADGRLSRGHHVIQHTGKSIDPERQSRAARPLRDARPRQSLRVRLRSRPRPDHELSVRRGHRQADANDPPSPPSNPAPVRGTSSFRPDGRFA